MELCEGSPPYFNVHPMRAIFIISSRPPPTLKEPEKWSDDMKDFVGRCFVKDCDKRASASELLKHPWIKSSVREIGSGGRGLPIIRDLIEDNWEALERMKASKMPDCIDSSGNGGTLVVESKPDDNGSTMRRTLSGIPATRQQLRNASLKRGFTYDGDGTMIARPVSVRDSGTLLRDNKDIPQHKREYFDEKDVDHNATLVSSVVRHNTVNRVFHQDTLVRKEDAGDMQAALKYFRDDPIPPPSEPKISKNGRDFANLEKVVTSDHSTEVAAETAILNEMIDDCSQAGVELMRKVKFD